MEDLDVKKNRKDEMFLSITESKKVVSGEGDGSQVSFEKHKIFLYKEDFAKFMTGLEQAINFIAQENNEEILPSHQIDESTPLFSEEEEKETLNADSIGGKIKIDIDFE